MEKKIVRFRVFNDNVDHAVFAVIFTNSKNSPNQFSLSLSPGSVFDLRMEVKNLVTLSI